MSGCGTSRLTADGRFRITATVGVDLSLRCYPLPIDPAYTKADIRRSGADDKRCPLKVIRSWGTAVLV
jgi:hypothetical protein